MSTWCYYFTFINNINYIWINVIELIIKWNFRSVLVNSVIFNSNIEFKSNVIKCYCIYWTYSWKCVNIFSFKSKCNKRFSFSCNLNIVINSKYNDCNCTSIYIMNPWNEINSSINEASIKCSTVSVGRGLDMLLNLKFARINVLL